MINPQVLRQPSQPVAFFRKASDFSTAGLTLSLSLGIPERGTIFSGAMIECLEAFTGGAVASATLSLGIAGQLTKFGSAVSVFTGTPTQISSYTGAYAFDGATALVATLTTTVANTSALTAGMVRISAFLANVQGSAAPVTLEDKGSASGSVISVNSADSNIVASPSTGAVVLTLSPNLTSMVSISSDENVDLTLRTADNEEGDTGDLLLITGDSTDGTAGNIDLSAGDGLAGGGDVQLFGGNETGEVEGSGGGSVFLQGGEGLTAGDVEIAGGPATGSANNGGNVRIVGGVGGDAANGGKIRLLGGGGAVDGGDIQLELAEAGSGRQGLLLISGQGLPAIDPGVVNALYHTAGAVMVSL